MRICIFSEGLWFLFFYKEDCDFIRGIVIFIRRIVFFKETLQNKIDNWTKTSKYILKIHKSENKSSWLKYIWHTFWHEWLSPASFCDSGTPLFKNRDLCLQLKQGVQKRPKFGRALIWSNTPPQLTVYVFQRVFYWRKMWRILQSHERSIIWISWIIEICTRYYSIWRQSRSTFTKTPRKIF